MQITTYSSAPPMSGSKKDDTWPRTTVVDNNCGKVKGNPEKHWQQVEIEFSSGYKTKLYYISGFGYYKGMDKSTFIGKMKNASEDDWLKALGLGAADYPGTGDGKYSQSKVFNINGKQITAYQLKENGTWIYIKEGEDIENATGVKLECASDASIGAIRAALEDILVEKRKVQFYAEIKGKVKLVKFELEKKKDGQFYCTDVSEKELKWIKKENNSDRALGSTISEAEQKLKEIIGEKNAPPSKRAQATTALGAYLDEYEDVPPNVIEEKSGSASASNY